MSHRTCAPQVLMHLSLSGVSLVGTNWYRLGLAVRQIEWNLMYDSIAFLLFSATKQTKNSRESILIIIDLFQSWSWLAAKRDVLWSTLAATPLKSLLMRHGFSKFSQNLLQNMQKIPEIFNKWYKSICLWTYIGKCLKNGNKVPTKFLLGLVINLKR